MKKYIEIFFPAIITIILTITIRYLLKEDIIQVNSIEFILSNIFSLVTTLMGFIVTTITVFVSLVKSKIMRYLKRNGKIKILLFYFIEPLIWGFFTILDICYLSTKFNELNNMYVNQLLVGVMLITLFILTILRVAIILCQLLFIIVEKPECIDEKDYNRYMVN